MRLADVHTWPLLRKRAQAAPGTATSRSASSNTMSGSMPPSSRLTRFSCFAAFTAISVPTAVEPVKAMQATSRVVDQRRADLGAVPVTTLTTPGGRCARASSTMRSVASGVSSDGLMTTVLPAASAGAIFQTSSSSG